MRVVLVFVLLCYFSAVLAQKSPRLRYEDKIRIREAIQISNKYGDQIFAGYSKVPFAIILISDSTDFLINHPYPSADFKLLEHDSILKADVYYRHSSFNPQLLATFPAVNGLSCIVVGTPENTNKSSVGGIL